MDSEEEVSIGAAGDPLECFEERLRVCFRHLDKSVDRDTLEPLLVRLLLVAACGAYEKTIRGAVDLRMADSGDMGFVQYLGSVTERHDMPFGVVSTERFRKALGRLPGTADMHLAGEITKMYCRLVQDRHSVAHGGETEITLEELQCMHGMAKGVPLAFAEALRRRFGQGG